MEKNEASAITLWKDVREINGLEDRVPGHLQVPHFVATEMVSDHGEEFWAAV